MARTMVGLDVGSTAVRAVELSLGSDRPAITRAAQVAVPEGSVENGEVADVEGVGQAIRDLWRRGGFRGKQVTMGVGGQRVVVREVTLPSLPEKELRQALPFQVQDLIPIPIEEAVLDFDVIEELEQEGRKMSRLLVVAAQRQLIDQQLEAILRAKLEPVIVDLVPFALVRSVGRYEGLGLEEEEGGSEAVVDVGADLTNICVHERGVPRFVRILPSGGDDITTAVAGQLGIPEEEAEALKRGGAEGGAAPSDDARQAIRDRSGALVDEIRSSVDFYRAQSPEARVGRVLVTGGGSRSEGFVDLLGQRLGIAAEPGRPFAKLSMELKLGEAEVSEAEPVLATAVGLALPQESAA